MSDPTPPPHFRYRPRIGPGWIALVIGIPFASAIDLTLRPSSGPGVVVEHARPGGGSSLGLFPGPRARELAEALQEVRTSGRRPTGRASS